MDYAHYANQTPQYQFDAFPSASAQSYEGQDAPMLDTQDVYSAATTGFHTYDPTYAFAANGFMPPQVTSQAPAHPTGSPDSSFSNPQSSIPALPAGEHTNGSFNGEPVTDGLNRTYNMEPEREIRNGSSNESDEKDPATPQQSRRKAQNRAAQRAFRERKERHVKELETRLNSLSTHSSSLLSDNQRLKKELQRLATQNEILRATSAQSGTLPRPPSPVLGPQTYSPTDFVHAVELDLHGKPISYDRFQDSDGRRLLAVGATWDLIQSHALFQRGMVDITEVMRRLKGKAACDGRGPAFKEAEVIQAIEESAQSSSDELI